MFDHKVGSLDRTSYNFKSKGIKNKQMATLENEAYTQALRQSAEIN